VAVFGQGAYGASMAHIRLVGGIATINRQAEARGADPELLYVYVRLFAKLTDGLLAIDPNAQSVGVGMQRDQLKSLSDQVSRSMGVAVGGVLPSELRAAHWGGVIKILAAQFRVSTDPETLMALPFDLLTVGGLSELIASSGP
jgi:hypothetical protein